jgi:ABC-2 type transport system ATP-binding protein
VTDAIACDALSVNTKNKILLNNVSFQIRQGQIVGLIGSNGAGKSTLLKAIVGLIPGVKGTCQIFGEDYRKVSAQQQLMFLPEKFHVAPALKGRDFFKIMTKAMPDESLCTHLRFEPTWFYNPIKTYSKGMLQKLGLLYLFSNPKPLLIADELMSGLDMQTREAVYFLMHQRRLAGSTIFFSTHITHDLNDVCDQILCVNEGTLRNIT